MRLISRLFGREKRPTQNPSAPLTAYSSKPTAAGRRVPPGAAEVFDFKENLVTAPAVSVAKHHPPPGTATVEIIGNNGKLIAFDTFTVSKPAPASAWYPMEGLPATLVRVGASSLRHQEFSFRLDGVHPIELPQHLLNKQDIGAYIARIWWSCEER